MKRYTKFSILFLLALTSLFVISTEISSGKKKYIKNGKEYGVVNGQFRGRWWNYYERGISFADGEFWAEAESDLRKAIKKRKDDKRRARKYGVHYLEYFPHRELGIVYYYQNKYENAESELMLSLSYEESSRAKYYLSKSRKSIIEQDKSDLSPPEISIKSPIKGTVVTGLDMTISGTSLDDKFVSGMAINGNPLFIETADKEISFSQKVRLKKGLNTVVVTATDLTGKVTSEEIPIIVDRQAPLLSIESIMQNTKNSYTITGIVTDETGVSELNIGGEIIPVTDKNEIKFSHTVSGVKGAALDFKVIDLSGNTTKGAIPLESLTITDKKPEPSQLDVGMHTVEKNDTTPPFIKLAKGIKKNQKIFLDSFFLEGMVKDAGGVASLSINNESVVIRHGIKLHFNYLAELNAGTNEFVIIATDEAGNSSKKAITVERKIPAMNKISSRLATAILPFQEKGEADTVKSTVPDLFLNALDNKKRFNILKRSELYKELEDHKWDIKDFLDKSTARRLGKLVSAELVIGGSIIETSRFLQIYARVIDTETSEVLLSTDVYGENKDNESIDYLIGGLSWKILKHFPVIKGTIVKIDRKKVYLSYSKEEPVRKNMKFIIYRHTGLDKGANEPEDIVEMLSEARVSEIVGSNISEMEVVSKLGDKPIQVNDLVITK